MKEYVVNEKGEKTRVILDIAEYEKLREAAEEAKRMTEHPGIAFRGPERGRRAWVPGTAFDVWEIVDIHQGKGEKRLFEEHPISGRQLAIALNYYEAHPEQIDAHIEENDQPLEYWHAKYPSLDIQVFEY